MREYLTKVLQSGRVAHAYLLLGPKHVGKTALALEFARALLCQGKKAVLGGCGTCPLCQAGDAALARSFIRLEAGISLLGKTTDLEEISVDDIRELRRLLSLDAAGGRVVLIQDAETMSLSAGNAFLKILEEPLPRVVFLLTASHPENLLPTIVSRVVSLKLSPVAGADLLAMTGATKELADLSGGLPGVLVRMREDAEFQQNVKEAAGDAVRALSASRGAAVGIAGRYALEGTEKEDIFLHHLFSGARNRILAAPNPEGIGRIRRALRILDLMHRTNVNARVAWDNLLLNSRTEL